MDNAHKIFPACFVDFPPEAERQRCAFYLAAEEYIAQNFPEDYYVFSWQIGPTALLGRNQTLHKEINFDFCKQHGIDVLRRKSGGGTVYADWGNLMTSLITPAGSVEPIFTAYVHQISDGLNRIGAPTEVSGRNDITLKGGGKICGNAFYHLAQHNIVHGTMLHDTQMDLMIGALNPDQDKLESQGVKSVRSRIALLKDYLPFGVDVLRLKMRSILTNRSVKLTSTDLAKIRAIEETYYTQEMIFGQTSKATTVCSERIEGCGRVEFNITLRGSIIDDLRLGGDFFEVGEKPAEASFREALIGLPFSREEITDRLNELKPQANIRRLEAKDVLHILFHNINEKNT